MQFIDLKAQQARIRTQIEENIRKVLDHGSYIMGPEIKELEEKLAGWAGTKHAIGVSSGTDALLMPLMALEVGPGDAVFTVSFTFVATAEVVSLVGATPVFVDILPDTYNMDPAALEAAIQKVIEEGKLNPKGIIPVDLFGQPADYEAIEKIARKYGLFVLEDAAQGFGSEYRGKRAGSFGMVAGTSFFPAKPLGTYGDGGMIFTDDDRLIELLRSIRVHGQGEDKYTNIRIGINGRLDSIMAAILLPKFDIFEEELELRQQVAQRYSEGLKGFVEVPYVRPDAVSAWAQYTVRYPERDRIINALKEEGIPTAVYYPIPLHLQKAYHSLGYQTGDLPVSERAAKEVFSLPMHPYLSAEDQDRIIEAVKKYV
ncbi:MAG: DegT/DnrJ/EryC1/StrS family aminotransferase [Bacteroidales bacterium]